MSIRVALKHSTSYRYDRKINLAPHVVRLRPAPHSKTNVTAYSLEVKPQKHFINWQQDPFGNYLARFVFPEKTDLLQFDVELVAEMQVINPFDFFLEEYAEKIPFEYPPWLKEELKPFLFHSDDSTELKNYTAKFVKKEATPTVEYLSGLVGAIAGDVKYLIRMQPGVQTPTETLTSGSGSCRDSAYLLVQMLRQMGLAARFVSGYLIQLVPDLQSAEEKERLSADFTDLHAWAEVYLPGAGWVGLDATSGLFASEGHIPLAATPEPQSASPITGAHDAAEVNFDFSMSVERLLERPRHTRPYAPEQWQKLVVAGENIDKFFGKTGLQLTMGGEPTFVGKEERDSAQWNTEALGEHKYECARKLLFELKDRYSSSALLQFSQGKWYPGEVLPRWSMNLYWLKKGQPLWSEYPIKKKEFETGLCQIFNRELCEAMALPEKYALPAFEDSEYYQWKLHDFNEEHEPENDFEKLEWAKLHRIQKAGLDKSIGVVLPLRFNPKLKRWQTCAWQLPREQLFATPGDSPLGYRLPINSLKSPDAPIAKADDNFNELGEAGQGSEDLKAKAVSEDFFVSALCVEVRDEKLYAFLPPLVTLDEFLSLVSYLHEVAAKLGYEIILEGYEPPSDQRLNVLKVTPDPGVIEVNIHPAHNFDELVETYQNLYEAAELAGLSTEKFLLDGRITGTGGGNHITLGGPIAAKSPFFKEPSLLRSLVTFWQHHPSLSYMFTGLFIGPTSQAPRVDESRDEILYELELALQQIDKREDAPPYVLDRLLRNFLVDITGNTHRAEICIDKLYSPDSATGRLGLVELRSFEMPPHYQMCVAQQLLIRTLLMRFHQQPYHHGLIHWQSRLHDKFLLPHFLWQDFLDVMAYVNYEEELLSADWYSVFLEFRLPTLGAITKEGIELELRSALQPWNVLGETVFASQTSRPVDSAVERIQVKVANFDTERFQIACNGYQVPLRATDEVGTYVGGVRYKGWNPTFTLHPYAELSQKLVFDIYDTVLQRSVGGCTYFVSHPGGRNYETMPVNHNEAEGRRLSRFWNFGHSQKQTKPPRLVLSSQYNYSLDLIRAQI